MENLLSAMSLGDAGANGEMFGHNRDAARTENGVNAILCLTVSNRDTASCEVPTMCSLFDGIEAPEFFVLLLFALVATAAECCLRVPF
jgi:hypothetical protein